MSAETPERAIDVSAATPILTSEVRALLEAAPDAMLILDASGTIVHVNAHAEALFGWQREQMIGHTVEMLVPERLRRAHTAHRSSYMTAPRPRAMGKADVELFGVRADGTEFPAEISLSPLPTARGHHAVAAIRDGTERRRVAEEREQLARTAHALTLRDEFLSIASHELKTPLAALQIQIDNLGRTARRAAQGGPIEPVIAKLDAMARAGGRLHRLVAQLLDLSRINGGHLNLEIEPLDLAEVVLGVAEQLRDESVRVGSPIAIDTVTLALHGDRLRLEQLVANLLGNALKYGAGKPVSVQLAQLGDGRLRLSVTDGGIGIAPEHRARVFERFERVVSGRNYGGFGLGLWISREIVSAHGGTIEVESEVGEGATFIVELPAHPPSPSVHPASAVAPG